MNYKIDLHTHSILSPDGGLSEGDYERLLAENVLDVIAVTDHNEITFAQGLQKKLGEKIIVGEEVMTTDGEIIGLFLKRRIESGYSAEQTAAKIVEQGGLVYIPHPFEVVRKGIAEKVLRTIVKNVAIIEVYNGRSWQIATRALAKEFVSNYSIAAAASSDSHCRMGIGRTYSLIDRIPTMESLVRLLQEGKLEKRHAPVISYFCPTMNRIRRWAVRR